MFKRGDIVKIVRGYWGSINDPDVGKIAVIDEEIMDSDGNIRYMIMERDTGHRTCWWYVDRLELVEEGGESDDACVR